MLMNTILVKNYYTRKQTFTIAMDYHDHMNEEAKNFARNLRILMEYYKVNQSALSAKSGVSQKTISNMINPGDDSAPNLDNVASVAKAFGLQTWHILYPDAPIDILINKVFEKFVSNYVHLDADEKDAWARVAEVSVKKYNKG